MAMTNAEKQARFRAKRSEEIERLRTENEAMRIKLETIRLRTENETLRAELETLKAQAQA
jgi:hypothetical protein